MWLYFLAVCYNSVYIVTHQIYCLKHEWHEWISTLLSYCERSGDGGGNPNSPLCELNPSESIGLNKMKVIWYQKEENEVCSAVNNSKPNYFMILHTRLIFNFYSYVCFYFNNALLCVLIETINYLKKKKKITYSFFFDSDYEFQDIISISKFK